jgi:hypothetical protein
MNVIWRHFQLDHKLKICVEKLREVGKDINTCIELSESELCELKKVSINPISEGTLSLFFF